MGERVYRWPDRDEPGIYRIGCSCGRYTFTGTAEEIHLASLSHDDSPWHNHVVGVRERVSEGVSDGL